MQGHEQKSPSYLPIERTYTLEEQVSGYKSSWKYRFEDGSIFFFLLSGRT